MMASPRTLRCWFLSLAALLTSALAPALRAAADGFDPNANGNVYASAIQSDGKVLLGGSFTTLQPNGEGAPVARNRLARVLADGSLDTGFAPVLNGDVTAVALQADGRILVGGRFTEARSSAGGTAYARNGLVRLAADGTVDTSFNPNPAGGSSSLAPIYAIAVQSDGRIVIGGGFTTLQPGASGTVYTRNRLARLQADGSVDGTFDPSANNVVMALAIQSDGKILVGGGFTTLAPAGGAAVERKRLARLNADGSLDQGFNPRADNRVLALALQADGKILAAGDFTQIHPGQDEYLTERPHLVRLNSDGTIDGNFNPRPNATITALAVQRDGRVLVAGQFSTFLPDATGSTVAKPWLARLTPDGAVEAAFSPEPNAAVATLALTADGRIVIGGYFSRVDSAGAIASLSRNRVARLLADGSLDTGFSNDSAGWVNTTAQDNEGRLLVGGYFRSFAGATRYNLARVRTDGTLDPDFRPEVNGPIQAILVQPDGKILIGGDFTRIGDVERTYLARLNADGSLDEAYDPSPSWSVYALYRQSDGRVLVGGGFTSFAPNGASTSTARYYLARLNADGTLDSWAPVLTSAVYAIVPQSDGKILLGGGFTTALGTARNYLARLNANLTIDTGFNPSPNALVRTIAVQSDGKILFGGAFTTLQLDDGQGDDDDEDDLKNDDADRDYLARVNADGTLDKTFNPTLGAAVTTLLVQSDGRILAGGAFTTVQPGGTGTKTTRERLVRLNSDGSIDTGFEVQANEQVYSIKALADGSVLLGGRFTSIYAGDGTSVNAENHVARLTSGGAIDRSWIVTAVGGDAVHALALQPDGRVLVGGNFSQLGGSARTNLARLHGSGLPDNEFSAAADGGVRALLVHRASLATSALGNAFAWLESRGEFRGSFDLAAAQRLSGRVNAFAVQADGAIIVAGYFSNRAGTTGRELARFRADGTLDTSFNPGPDATVNAIAIQPDGKILIAGGFGSVGGVVRRRVARLNADGSVDDSFSPMPLNGVVNAMVLLSDGRIVVGGTFTAMDIDDGEKDDDDGDDATDDDTAIPYLTMMSSGGTWDSSFRPNPNGAVEALLLAGDGRLYVAGSFTALTPAGASASTARGRVALIGLGAAIDATFNPSANGSVYALALQGDGKLLIGGEFTQLAIDDGEADDDDGDSATDDDADRFYLARINTDGTLDRNFKPTPNGNVRALAVDAGGGVYVGGEFTGFTPNDADTTTTRRRLSRLHSDGQVDLSFGTNANGAVRAILVRPDGSVLVGGAFTALDNARPIFVGGEFTTLGAATVPRLARLNFDGNPDSGFAPNPDGAVRALAEQADGRLLVGGDFSTLAGAGRSRLARLLADGSLDGSYAPAANGRVAAIAVESGGTAIVGGEFTVLGGVSRSRLARVRADGVVATDFNPSVDGEVVAVAIQADGKVLIGGSFASVGGVSRSRLARLNVDGSVDGGFNPAPNGAVTAISVRADGRIEVAGDFTQIAGSARERVARLQADGSLDASLTDGADATVRTLLSLPDGRTLAGGAFTRVRGSARYLVARLGAAVAAAQTLAVSTGRDAAVWTWTGGVAELTAAEFAWSTDGELWTALGSGVRTGTRGQWRWSGGSVFPATGAYYVRARGVLPVTQGGSGGVVESVWQFVGTTPSGYGYPAVSTASADALAESLAAAEAAVATVSYGSTTTTTAAEATLASADAATIPGRLVRAIAILALEGGAESHVGLVVEGTTVKPVTVQAASTAVPAVAFRVESAEGIAQANGTRDAAADVSLAPGAFRIRLQDPAAQGGMVALAVEDADPSADAELVGLTVSGTTSTASSTLGAQLRVGGGSTRAVLIRGLSSALTDGVSAVDPVVRIWNTAGELVAWNDDWETAGLTTASPEALTAATTEAGGLPLAPGSRDAAVLVHLSPGDYTVKVEDPDQPEGIVVLEVLVVP